MSKLKESAFELSNKEMKQIRYLEMLKKRKADHKQGKIRFSDKLSTEAQLAMVMALEDADNEVEKSSKEAKKKTDLDPQEPTAIQSKKYRETSNIIDTVHEQNEDVQSESGNSSGKKSYAELYKENGMRRMKNDITDKDFKPENLSKRPLDPYGKLESAMEIVETIRYELDDISSDDDAEFIEQIAQQNSVDKCKIWITANSQDLGRVKNKERIKPNS